MSVTAKFSAGLGIGGLLMAASIAAAQVSVNAPPPGTAGPTNVQAGGVNVQTAPGGGTSITVPPGAAGAVGERIRENAAARQENRADWRMVRHNNEWWYWHPNNNWSVYRNNAWGPYTAGSNMQGNYYARRGPLGLRRYSTGYRGVAPSGGPPLTAPTPPSSTMAPDNNSAPATNQAPANNPVPGNPAPANK